jgi:glycerol-3-phosphate O-acyltransferase/dihydroxyacetone phosphate acyltransferase
MLSRPLIAGSMEYDLLTKRTAADEPNGCFYKITPYIDQSQMYHSVVRRLSKGLAVGIFPEGGSHDRPELLPINAGVAIYAFEALAKYPGCNVKIVPTGLHYYFHGHKFRSRAVVEYGEPISIPIELVDQYRKGGILKRQAVASVLEKLQIQLKALTLESPDFDTLMVSIIYTGCSGCQKIIPRKT